MMDFPLALPVIMRRAETYFGDKEIISRRPDKSIHRTTYKAVIGRARRLAGALGAVGMNPGDRIATLGWNSAEHLEAYYAVGSGGYVLHTLNLRLHPDDLAYIATHARDRLLIVDESLLPLASLFRERTSIEQVYVIRATDKPLPEWAQDYESLLEQCPAGYDFPDIDESMAAGMCYTSGTTGRPKGVLYSHRSLTLHAMAASMPPFRIDEPDRVLAIVPMFHANAWGMPFTAALIGATQIFPGQFLDPHNVLDMITEQKATVIAGVPTVVLGLLKTLDDEPGKHDVSRVHTILCGGSAPPKAMIQALQERHGLRLLQAWGMTETSPIGTVAAVPSWMADASDEDKYTWRSRAGVAAPFVETRARAEDGSLVPWDGQAMGELEVRGPWVAKAYYASPDSSDRFTDDGWFKTGDVVSIDAHGCVEIKDRSKDVVKSGGEWISSVALENALMGHPAVLEAAVIGVAHPKWDERPLAVVLKKPGVEVTHEELVAHLATSFAKWWLPDSTEFVDAIPKTSVGKFDKKVMRDLFADRLGGR